MADVVWKGFGAFVKAPVTIPRYTCKYFSKKWKIEREPFIIAYIAAVHLHSSSFPQSYCIRFFAVIQSTWFSPDRSVVYRYSTRGCYTHTTWCGYITANSSLSRACQNGEVKFYTDFFWQLNYFRKHHRISGNLAVMSLSHDECIINWSK